MFALVVPLATTRPHHMPDGYIGNPADELALGDLVRERIQQLTSPGKQAYWTDKLESDLELVRNYITWKGSGHPNYESRAQYRASIQACFYGQEKDPATSLLCSQR